MAIKSKSRSKGGKHVARPPRPVPVEVKPPFFVRKRVQVVLAFVAGIAVSAVVVWARNGLDAERARDRQQEVAARARQALGQYQSTVDTALSSVGSPLAPDAFAAFLELGDALDRLEKGRADPNETAKTGRDVAERAKDASDAIDGVDVSSLVAGKGFEFELVDSVFDSQDSLVSGLDLFGQAGQLAEKAARADPQESERLAEQARSVYQTAQTVFQDGYSDYANALQKAGLAAPFGPPPTFPGP